MIILIHYWNVLKFTTNLGSYETLKEPYMRNDRVYSDMYIWQGRQSALDPFLWKQCVPCQGRVSWSNCNFDSTLSKTLFSVTLRHGTQQFNVPRKQRHVAFRCSDSVEIFNLHHDRSASCSFTGSEEGSASRVSLVPPRIVIRAKLLRQWSFVDQKSTQNDLSFQHPPRNKTIPSYKFTIPAYIEELT